MRVTVETLVNFHRSISDVAQTTAGMAATGDSDAIEIAQYLVWTSHALAVVLRRRIEAAQRECGRLEAV